MAKQQSVTLVDDLDGGKAAETVRFGLDGALYEIAPKQTECQRTAQISHRLGRPRPKSEADTRPWPTDQETRRLNRGHSGTDPRVGQSERCGAIGAGQDPGHRFGPVHFSKLVVGVTRLRPEELKIE